MTPYERFVKDVIEEGIILNIYQKEAAKKLLEIEQGKGKSTLIALLFKFDQAAKVQLKILEKKDK